MTSRARASLPSVGRWGTANAQVLPAAGSATVSMFDLCAPCLAETPALSQERQPPRGPSRGPPCPEPPSPRPPSAGHACRSVGGHATTRLAVLAGTVPVALRTAASPLLPEKGPSQAHPRPDKPTSAHPSDRSMPSCGLYSRRTTQPLRPPERPHPQLRRRRGVGAELGIRRLPLRSSA